MLIVVLGRAETKTAPRQFSLRGLLVGVTIVGLICGGIGWELRKARTERNAFNELTALGASGDIDVLPRWPEHILGYKFAPIVEIAVPPEANLEQVLPLLMKLKKLEYLDLSGCSVADSHVAQLVGLTSIVSLKLTSTDITDKSLSELKQFARLRWLYVADTALTDDGIRQLKSEFPFCQINQ